MVEWGGSMYLMTVVSFAVPREGEKLNRAKSLCQKDEVECLTGSNEAIV